MSINGAKIFADKREAIAIEMKTDINTRIDSINVIFTDKVTYKIKERDNLIENRDIYNEKIRDANYTSRLKEYNALITTANKEIRRADTEIDRLREEQKGLVSSVKNEAKSDSELKVQEIFKNQIAFIIISSFIELLILVGIWFHSLFRLKIYREYKDNIKNSMNYKIYLDYSSMLSVLFQNGKINYESPLPSATSFAEAIRRKEEYSHKYIKEFITLCKELGIVVQNRQRKNIAAKKYEDARELIANYYSTED